MKKMKRLLPITAAGIGILLAAACLYAGTSVPDVVDMNNKAYPEHKKGIVTFSHKKHAADYPAAHPDLYKNGCGECHHDESGAPLADLKEGDEVQNCIACHDKPGLPPRTGKDAPRLTDEEKMAYHAYALHDNCKGCHKNFNDTNNTKAAPTTCSKCHPRD